MKHLSSIVLTAAVLAAGTVACFKDPTSSLRNGPSQILLTRSSVFLAVNGDSLQVQAEVKDAQGNTYDVSDASWTSSNPAVAVVNPTTSQYIPYNALSRAFIHTAGPGIAWVFFASHGLKDSIQVFGVPGSFGGTVTAPSGTMMGDTITIAATPELVFTSGTTVDIDGTDAFILSQSANQLKILPGAPGSTGTMTLHGLTLFGTITVDMAASTTVKVAATVRSANEPANDAPATAPSFTLYASPLYGVLTAADVDDYWKFTTPATGDSVDVSLSWNTDADIDGYVLNATGGCTGAPAGGCAAMGTSANPEKGHFRLAANTTYQFDANLYDAGSATAIAYKVTFTKVQ